MFDTTSAPYSGWQKLGQRVLQDIESGKIAKGKGLVCVSAHWENESGNGREKEVIVNVDQGNPLIYDCEWDPWTDRVKETIPPLHLAVTDR